jgi:DHA1 family inner membrane transport protein
MVKTYWAMGVRVQVRGRDCDQSAIVAGPSAAGPDNAPMPRLLIAFALCNLVIGTGAFVVTGLVAPMAEDLGTSAAAAGQATTAYALATALLAPAMVVATGAWSRRAALVLAMAVFAAGNALRAVAPNLTVLLAGRVLMGVGAMFTPVAAGIAVALVQPARRGRALSIVFLGVSLSYVIGLPLGAWLGLGYGWRWPVALVAVVAAAATVAMAVALPRDIRAPGATFDGLPALLRRPGVAGVLAMTMLYFVAIFIVFSYIGPVLKALQPMSAAQISLTLMLFGLSGVIGTLVGGWENDRIGPIRTLWLHLGALALTMALVPLTAGSDLAIVAVFFAWGIAGFGMMTPQQSRLAVLSPSQAPLLLSLNTSMLYAGTALGAAIGGAAAPWVGFDKLAWVAVPFALAAMGLLAAHRRAMPAPAT